MSTDVKSDKNWKPATIKIDLKSIGAATLALISGFTMSGGIMLVAGMLQGDITSFPHYLYNKNFIASLFFGASILTWAGINYTEMRKLFGRKPTKLERLSGRVNSANMVFSIQDKSYEANVLNQVVSEHIEQQLIESKNALKGATAYLDSKQNTLASKINYGMRRIPGLKTINDYLSGRSQLKQRVSYLNELSSDQLSQKPSKKVAIPLTDTERDILITNIEFDIPQLPAKTLKETIYRTFSNSIYTVTLINSFMINNIGAVMFGAMSFLSLFNITTYPLKILIVSLFGIVGTLSSLSFSSPNVINGVNSLFGYKKPARDYLKQARQKGKTSGFFPLSSSLQQLLAVFLASSAAIGNYTANVAFGEALFSGKSIFDSSVLLGLMSNPFSAHPYSLAFGIIGGFGTWVVVAVLLINGTLAIQPKEASGGKKSRSLKKILVDSISGFFVSLSASSLILWFTSPRQKLKPSLVNISKVFFTRAIAPIFFTAVAITACYETYKQCKENSSHWLTNLCISATMISSTFISYYLNALPGSTFSKLLPPLAAKSSALITAIGNAELSFSLFNCSRNSLDSVLKSQSTLKIREQAKENSKIV